MGIKEGAAAAIIAAAAKTNRAKIDKIISDNPNIRYFITFRSTPTNKTTIGEVFLSTDLDTMFTYSLEDMVRPYGEKVDKETAIFENFEGYMMESAYSGRFKRNIIRLYTEKDGKGNYYIKYGGIEFHQASVHGGNDKDDTEGCPLVCKNKISDEYIQGTTEKLVFNKFTEWEAEGYECRWITINGKEAA